MFSSCNYFSGITDSFLFPLGPSWLYRRSDNPDPGFNLFQLSLPCEKFSPSSHASHSYFWAVFRSLDGSITVHRGDMIDIWKRRLPKSCAIHTSKKLTHYEEGREGKLTLYFKDGTTALADVLVGADGVKSATRRTLFQSLAKKAEINGGKNAAVSAEALRKSITPVWTGTVAYRCLIPTERLQKLCPGHRACTTGLMVRSCRLHIYT